MKKSELRQIIREEISKTLNEVKLPRKVENLIKQHNAKDIYDLIDILKKKDSTIAEELKVTRFPFTINDENGNEIYFERSDGWWFKTEYNPEGYLTYYENSKGGWYKKEWDSDGNEIYFEDSKDYWIKREYDSQGNEIYYKNSSGYWIKREYDSNGNEIYSEDSNGEIIDNR